MEGQIRTMTKLSKELEISLQEIDLKFMEFKSSIQRTVSENITKTSQEIEQINIELKRMALYKDL